MSQRLPRQLHPGAWWLWALGMATAVSRTTNVISLIVFAAVVGCVVSFRRSDAPWARGFGTYLRLGLVVIAVRVVFRVLLDGAVRDNHSVHAAAGSPARCRGGRPHRWPGQPRRDCWRRSTTGSAWPRCCLCFGAANVLADPKRLLKSLPAALHEIGVAMTVALTVAPQLVESGQRIRRARKLRGAGTSHRGLIRGVMIPVLEDALDRSLVLAAAMDSRGYGRHADQARRTRVITATLVLVGVAGVFVGTYGVLDGTTPRLLGGPMLAAGCFVAVAGIRVGGNRVRRSSYRPDPWALAEWMVVVLWCRCRRGDVRRQQCRSRQPVPDAATIALADARESCPQSPP